jgi:hypothetical protein
VLLSKALRGASVGGALSSRLIRFAGAPRIVKRKCFMQQDDGSAQAKWSLPKYMKKSIRHVLLLPVALVCLAACSTSHVIVGKTRAPTDPDQIKVFLAPPKHYETIAVVSSDSNGSFRFGAQAKTNAALDLKQA